MHTPTSPVETAYPSAACSCSLFVPNQNMANLRLENSIVERERSPAWQAKDILNAQFLERTNYRPGTRDLLANRRLSWGWRHTHCSSLRIGAVIHALKNPSVFEGAP